MSIRQIDTGGFVRTNNSLVLSVRWLLIKQGITLIDQYVIKQNLF